MFNRRYLIGALDEKEASPKIKWKSKLPFEIEPEQYDTRFERDIQFCIIRRLEVRGEQIHAYNCKENVYILDVREGRLLNLKKAPFAEENHE